MSKSVAVAGRGAPAFTPAFTPGPTPAFTIYAYEAGAAEAHALFDKTVFLHGDAQEALSDLAASIGQSTGVHHVHDQPFTRTAEGGVEFDEDRMELRRPYPFNIGGEWFVAAKHAAGDVRIYELV